MCLSHLWISGCSLYLYNEAVIDAENSLSRCHVSMTLSGDLPPPFSVAFVKGWRRSVTCLVVADAIRALEIDFGDLTSVYKVHFVTRIQKLQRNTVIHRTNDFEGVLMSGLFFPTSFSQHRVPAGQESMRVVHATMGRYSHVSDQVLATRGGPNVLWL